MTRARAKALTARKDVESLNVSALVLGLVISVLLVVKATSGL